MIKFPESFLWGAATSSHQVEGNNSANDWWEWENRGGGKDKSGQACRHYELFRKDFDIAKSLNHNAHRLSIEWSRVEPREGEFCASEIKHYCDMIEALRERGLEPVVTLHHFTNPAWFSKMGGWENKLSAGLFARYAQKMADSLPKIKYWVTINEPMVYVFHSYLKGVWPPQEKSLLKAYRVTDNLVKGHIAAFKALKDSYLRKSWHVPKISIAKHFQAFVPCTGSRRDRLAASIRDYVFNFYFLNRVIKAGSINYIGVNYYTRQLVHTRGWGVSHLTDDVCAENHHALPRNSLGWDIYPDGLYDTLKRLRKFNLPMLITENGICVSDDKVRWDFIKAHLQAVSRAIAEGAGIIGYLYWSLLDNFEWAEGFEPRFGLVEMNYSTQERAVRESARKFADVCAANALEED